MDAGLSWLVKSLEHAARMPATRSDG